MKRYHISPETGEPNPCTAKIKCKFGENIEHYSSKKEARDALEKQMTESTLPEPIKKYAYHVTTDESLPEITENGLIPRIGERSSDFGETKDAIYLFPTVEDLEDGLGGWLGESFEDYEGDLHVLKVDITDSQVSQEVDWEIISHEAIPADKITYSHKE